MHLTLLQISYLQLLTKYQNVTVHIQRISKYFGLCAFECFTDTHEWLRIISIVWCVIVGLCRVYEMSMPINMEV